MSEPNNGHTQQQPGRQTKGEIVAQREQVRMLGIALGNWREAARQCGLSEGRVLNWCATAGNSQNASKHISRSDNTDNLRQHVTWMESLQERLKHDAEATRV